MSLDTVEVANAHKVRMSDLARLAGVSIATVSRSLNDSPLINRVTKSRVWQVACDHGYAAGHTMPEALREATKTVAIIVPYGTECDHQAITCGLISAARDMNCNLLFSHLGPYDHNDLAAVMQQKDADAFVFLGDDGLHGALNALAASHRMIVWGDAAHDARYDCAGPDDFACGVTAAAHLASLGHKRIAYLGDIAGPGMQQRFMGYLTGLTETGLPFNPSLVLHSLPADLTDLDAVFVAGEPEAAVIARASASSLPMVAFCPSPRASRPGLAILSIDPVAAGRALLSRLLRQQGDNDHTVKRFPVALTPLP